MAVSFGSVALSFDNLDPLSDGRIKSFREHSGHPRMVLLTVFVQKQSDVVRSRVASSSILTR